MIERAEAPVLDMPGGWDAVYRERTSAKRRSLHGRRRRQPAGLGEVAFEVARTPEELATALEEARQIFMSGLVV